MAQVLTGASQFANRSRPCVPFGRYTLSPPSTSRSCRSTRTRPAPTRGGRSGRRGAGTSSEATSKRTGELLVAHRGSPTPEVLHQPQFLECEVVAEPRKRALKVAPRPPQKGRVCCSPACQVPQYVLAHEHLPRVWSRWRRQFTFSRASRPPLTGDLHLHRPLWIEAYRKRQRRCRNRR